MSDIAKIDSNLMDFYKNSFQKIQSLNKTQKSFLDLKENIFDIYSSESLKQYKLIEQYLVSSNYHTNFSKDQEKTILQKILENTDIIRNSGFILLKRNWEAVVLKRKILPASCFVSSKFCKEEYKCFLIEELFQNSGKKPSLLTLCYHYATEYQETCALLLGEVLDVELITLEFILEIEHKNKNFKHSHLYICDLAILEMFYKKINQESYQSKYLLEDFYGVLKLTKKYTNEQILQTLINKEKVFNDYNLALKDNLTLEQLSSLYCHLENLILFCQNDSTKILDLVKTYIVSLNSNLLFFEESIFHEVPIVVEILLSAYSQTTAINAELEVLKFIETYVKNSRYFFFEIIPQYFLDTSSEFNSLTNFLTSCEYINSIEIGKLLSFLTSMRILSKCKDAEKKISLLILEGKKVENRIFLNKK